MHEEATDGQLVCFSLRVLQARQLSSEGVLQFVFFPKVFHADSEVKY